ncbi:hypothetical protein M0R45_031040 [Rubus argutus]|uniref:BUB1 N-terminal domain-containing protein n=1 Tax=Rubus argutus TaxID=59490 RepID=A0AAW1WFA0_RUBAR
MAAVSQDPTPLHDPLLPSLWSIKQALDDLNSGKDSGSGPSKLLSDCIAAFKDNVHYRDDIRFLKIWFLYMGCIEDSESVFLEMLDRKICIGHSFALCLMGISRNAKPPEWVNKAHALFLQRMSELVSSPQKVDNHESIQFGNHINPWSNSTMKGLLQKISPQLRKYDGYHTTTKAYSGKVALSSLKNLIKEQDY